MSHRAWTPFVAGQSLSSPKVLERQQSEDGTTKYALDFDGTSVETVRIPAKGRSTICVSSQAGCTRKCVFCATKELGFIRQLKAEEMVAQYLLARSEAPEAQPASNVVFMGMGEPMDNLDEVLRAVEVLTQSPAPQLRHVAVTVSTSGVLPGLKRFLAESKASLALSLNATTDEVRAQVMPQNKTWPIASLLEALREDVVRRDAKRAYFIEYVLFGELNDTDADADRLVALAGGHSVPGELDPLQPVAGHLAADAERGAGEGLSRAVGGAGAAHPGALAARPGDRRRLRPAGALARWGRFPAAVGAGLTCPSGPNSTGAAARLWLNAGAHGRRSALSEVWNRCPDRDALVPEVRRGLVERR